MTTLVGILLSVVVVAGTWLYVAGIAPSYPWNTATFNGMLLVCLGFALWRGRARN